MNDKLKEYKNFLEYLKSICGPETTIEELTALYDKDVEITFNNHTIQIPFDVVIWNGLINLVNTIIKEY
jgi:hypothetical protein